MALMFLHKLFNILLVKGCFPSVLSKGYIVPIHKKGNIHNVDNYRGITLLSVMGKLLTRILNTRLTNWAETYYVYIEAQAEFRSEMGTVDNIFVLHGLNYSFDKSREKAVLCVCRFQKGI